MVFKQFLWRARHALRHRVENSRHVFDSQLQPEEFSPLTLLILWIGCSALAAQQLPVWLRGNPCVGRYRIAFDELQERNGSDLPRDQVECFAESPVHLHRALSSRGAPGRRHSARSCRRSRRHTCRAQRARKGGGHRLARASRTGNVRSGKLPLCRDASRQKWKPSGSN